MENWRNEITYLYERGNNTNLSENLAPSPFATLTSNMHIIMLLPAFSGFIGLVIGQQISKKAL
jgi:hypothetical protein